MDRLVELYNMAKPPIVETLKKGEHSGFEFFILWFSSHPNAYIKIRKKGDWWDKHIEEQAKMLEKLRTRGYKAEFGVGLEECKQIIDEYLRN